VVEMPSEERRRKKHPVKYEIVFVPQGEGGKKRSFSASRLRLWILGLLSVSVIVALVIMVLIYTPITMYVPIRNPVLEERYGKQILETQQRLSSLAQEVLVLRDYNDQLRKALGENSSKDSTKTNDAVAKPAVKQSEQVVAEDAGQRDVTSGEIGSTTDSYGDYDMGTGDYKATETSDAEFRAAFPLLVPTEGFVTQGFDPGRRHYGVDYATKTGTPVYAATDGYVVFSGWTYDDGNMLILSHGGGYLTVYKHNQLLLRTEHAFVKRGELIAESGSSGQTSSGPHLHFEVWKDGLPRNPQEFLLIAPKVQ
jgi:murein DD-endopeptidase MepM/ murein hydrolase activator NlpD